MIGQFGVALRCGSLIALLMISSPVKASFDSLAGSWSGFGSMKPSDGARERVRCKAIYTVSKPGKSIGLDLKCASDAYKMALSANIDQDGTTLSGNWFESQYRQGGKISGTNKDGLIEARVEGDTVTALVKIRTRENHQSFSMESPGAWLSQVEVELTRERP